ncbi:hypothetical protein H5U35_07040, partial [Candidatus Aerophobetes bacterium]|nr:hypothetical protein [Candidatus Aerophobetes bacterium]
MKGKLLVMLAGVILIIFPGETCFPGTKMSIQIEPAFMELDGFNLHSGDIFYYQEKWNSETGKLNYGTTYEPINLDMQEKVTLQIEALWKKNSWGIGVRGWWFDTEDSKSGEVTTPPASFTPTSYVYYDVYYENGVRMWDHTIWPVVNDLEDSFFSPVKWYARGDIKAFSADVFGAHTIGGKEKNQLEFLFGAKFATLDTKREEGQFQRAYISCENFDELESFPPEDFPEKHDWDNYISLQSKSTAKSEIMAGPCVGLRGRTSLKKWKIEGFLNQSVLFGKTKLKGNWKDVDNICSSLEGEPQEQYQYWEGNFSFSKSEKIALPLTEINIKIIYPFSQ